MSIKGCSTCEDRIRNETMEKNWCIASGQNCKRIQGKMESLYAKNGPWKTSEAGYELMARWETKYWQTDDEVVIPDKTMRPGSTEEAKEG